MAVWRTAIRSRTRPNALVIRPKDSEEDNAIVSFVIVKMGARVGWLLNDHPFPVNCTNTMRKIPPGLEFVGEYQPLSFRAGNF